MATFFDRGPRGDLGQPAGVLGAVAVDPQSTGLTYEPFYGLRQKPFSLTSDARFFYQSRSHAPAFDDLLRAVNRRESLTVLTGDIGTGKTTLCRAVLDSLDCKTFSAFVPDPFASREDLLKLLLTEFGVASAGDVTSGRLRDASRTELTYLLHEFLGTLAPLQAFAVVFVDEAQNLSVPLLEELRILSDADGQMQVVLVGQLELEGRLQLPEMRQLDQRVSARCRLRPLDLAGVAGYVSHRLHRAGGSADRISFSGDAIEAIYERSGGVPRVVNKLCDRALHVAYARKAAVVDREMVDAANPDHLAGARAVQVPVGVPAGAPPVPPAPALSAAPPAAALAAARPAPPLPPASIPLAPPLCAAPAPIAPAPTSVHVTAPPATAPPPSAASAPVEPAAFDPATLDAWMNSLDDGPEALPLARTVSIGPEQDRALPRTGSEPRARLRIRVGYAAPAPSVRAMPTHVPRKWTRRLELVAFSLVLMLVALMLGPAAWDAAADTGTYVAQQFEPPAPPPIAQRPSVATAPPVLSPRAIDPLSADASQ
jgi:type II secretory pathway predicted ATPase ExeA